MARDIAKAPLQGDVLGAQDKPFSVSYWRYHREETEEAASVDAAIEFLAEGAADGALSHRESVIKDRAGNIVRTASEIDELVSKAWRRH